MRRIGTREDIVPLAKFFLRKYAHEAKREVRDISEAAMNCLKTCDWPGNIRELENAIERAVVLGTGEEIDPEDLPEQVLSATSSAAAEVQAGYHTSVKDFQRQLIQSALEQAGGNQSRAAQILGLQRTYLSRLIRNLGLR